MQTINKRDADCKVLRTFKLLYTVYVYDGSQDIFKPLPDMPEGLPLQIFNARKALALIDAGKLFAVTDCEAPWQAQTLDDVRL